jgi:hypothetical protein
MDCTSARLLLRFVRTGELDRAEQETLDSHLSACMECSTFAQSENRFDDTMATAMQCVPVPDALKDRILERLTRARRPHRWRWAAAAAVLVAAGLVCFVVLTSGPDELNPLLIAEKVDTKLTPDAVEGWFFGQLGTAVTLPRDFNFTLLDSFDIAEIQGRKVPKLTFQSVADKRLAHVYVLSTRQFQAPVQQENETALKDGWLGEIFIPASSQNIQIRRHRDVPDFFYLIVYTSASLDPFLLQGI